MSKETGVKIIVMLLVLINTLTVSAQVLGKEAWHWHFGYGVALDFTTGTPVVGSSATNTREGTASFSNPSTGQLLFYTDGVSVWDKNNNQMPNGFGLLGSGSSTQSALIIPKPGNSSVFYVFTSYAVEDFLLGYYYSVVDLSLNGGLGDVTIKNQLLYGPNTEKLTAVKHCNGVDYWLITHESNTNVFRSYLITNSGINLSPVLSSVGVVHDSNDQNGLGYIRVSPDGKKLANAIYGFVMNRVELFDFNTSTGVISNPIAITNSLFSGMYGVAFSPNNSVLYASDGSSVYQMDISSNNTSTILSSIISVGVSGYSTLQIGPDDKIYIAHENTSFLSIINNPNNLGTACSLTANSISLSPVFSGLGLPNFFYADLSNSILGVNDIAQCNAITPTVVDAGVGFTNYLWSNGATTQTNTVSSPGKYWIAVTNTLGCTATDTFDVSIVNPANLNILKDTTVCIDTTLNQSYYAVPSISGVQSYLWSNGNTGSAILISQPGTYWVDYTFLGGCVVRDSFDVLINIKPQTPILPIGCVGTAGLTLDANPNNVGGYNYSWSTGATTSSIVATTGGGYTITISSSLNCLAVATTTLFSYASIFKNLPNDTTLCASSLTLDVLAQQDPNETIYYYWTNPSSTFFSSNNPETFTTSDTYYLSVTIYDNNNFFNPCYYYDTITINFQNTTPISLGSDVNSCSTNYTLTSNATSGPYLWNTGATTSSITVNISGNYWLQTGSGSCASSDTVLVTLVSSPILSVNNDTICIGQQALLTAISNSNSFIWQPVNETGTSITVSPTSSSTYTVTASNGNCTTSKTTTVVVNLLPNVNVGNDFVSYPGQEFTLTGNSTTSNITYEWNPPQSLTCYTCNTTNGNSNETTTYTLTVTDENGCSSFDEIVVTIRTCANGDGELFIPTIFSPNNDGKNDVLFVRGFAIQEMWFQVFDRWGQRVFESTKLTDGWDGTFKGQALDPAVYIYLLDATCASGEKIIKKGNVTLVR